jgi:hypothetical protein
VHALSSNTLTANVKGQSTAVGVGRGVVAVHPFSAADTAAITSAMVTFPSW